MNLRRLLRAKVIGGHHAPKSGHERPLWIGQESRDARQRLFLLGVKDMKDCADQKGVRRFFPVRSEEHTSELQSLMRISYAVFCLNKKKQIMNNNTTTI